MTAPALASALAAARALAFVVAATLALGAGACGGSAPPVARVGSAPTPEALLRILDTRRAAVRSLNARARATSWIGGDRLRASVLMLVEREGRLRFEAEISLQGTVSILTTDGGRFQLLDLRNNQLQQGPACPANVASLIRIPLAPAEVAAILLGDVWLPAKKKTTTTTATAGASVVWDATRGADVLVIKDHETETKVFFHPRAKGQGAGSDEDEDILGAAASGPAGPLWRTSYEDIGDAPGGLRLPSLIRFAERGGSFDDGVEIRFKDRTANPEMRPDSFAITPPAGTRVVEVGCDADNAGVTPRP